MDINVIDTSDLVYYLATKSTLEYYKAYRAKVLKSLEPITFKQALRHP